jgi:hypothetical protein
VHRLNGRRMLVLVVPGLYLPYTLQRLIEDYARVA